MSAAGLLCQQSGSFAPVVLGIIFQGKGLAAQYEIIRPPRGLGKPPPRSISKMTISLNMGHGRKWPDAPVLLVGRYPIAAVSFATHISAR